MPCTSELLFLRSLWEGKRPKSLGKMTQSSEKENFIPKLASELKIPRSRYVPSWAQFLMRERFERIDFSIGSVFSIRLNIPAPPPPQSLKHLQSINRSDFGTRLRSK
jgi:hypothetical protein